MFSFLCITLFPKRQPVLFEKQWLFIQIIFLFYFYFLCFYLFSIFILFFFIFFIFFLIFLLFFLFYFFLFFPYFRGNSLNSRADLEFKEIRLFSTMIFQKKNWNSMFFSKNPNGFSFCTMIFPKKQRISSFFWKIIVEKSRISLNSRSALEFKEFPRK